MTPKNIIEQLENIFGRQPEAYMIRLMNDGLIEMASKKQEYFYYTNWKESIGGYKRGIQYKYLRKDYKDYYHFLSEIGYATDPQYIIKLKKIVKKL